MRLHIYALITLILIHPMQASFVCNVCSSAVQTFSKFLNLIIPNFVAVQLLEAMCVRKYDSLKLCLRVAQEIAPLAISNCLKKFVNAQKICNRFCNNSFIYYDAQEEVKRIMSGAEHESMNLSKYVKYSEHSLVEKQQITILQLSDIHLDNDYTQNASVFCEYPICCHPEHGFPQNPSAKAKKYGNKNCDTPKSLLHSFLDFMNKTERIDAIMVTGDIAAHNQWQKTLQTVQNAYKQTQKAIKQALPQSIVMITEGNNDYVPDHQLDASQNSVLIKIDNILVGKTKLTFVALNSIVFDELNLYVLGDQSYMIFQLRLLEQILKDPLNENIYLTGHFPVTMSGTIAQYAAVFRAIIAKYSHKIKGQFYGHIHSDQLAVNTSPETQEITGFAFVSPSVSPLFIGSSRSRVFTIDTIGTYGVIDYNQYILKDLESSPAQWKLQYNFRQKFSLLDSNSSRTITLSDMHDIKNRIFSDKNFQRVYVKLTGLAEDRGQRSYCNILDDIHFKKQCFNRSASIVDNFTKILEWLRGTWGYKKSLAS